MEIENKVAMVTGAVSGIGLAITHQLLKNKVQGVIMVDINRNASESILKKIVKEFGLESAIFVPADISNEEEFENAFKKGIEIYGHIDIVINNAAIMNDVDYSLCIKVNLIGTATGTYLGLKYLGKDKAGQGGTIINIASIAAYELQQTYPTYSATKAGIINLSKGFGHKFHYSRTGVKVIALCPGATITPIHSTCKFLPGCMEEIIKHILPSGNYQLPDAVAHCMMYVLNNADSGTVWLAESKKLYLISQPSFDECKKLIEMDQNDK